MKRNFIANLNGKTTHFVLLGIFITLIWTNSAFAQTEKEVVKIRADVAAINKGAAKYTKILKDIEDISLEGAEATYYHLAGKVKKITTEMLGETFNSTGELYYKDRQLIFAFIKRRQYDTQIGVEPPPKVVDTQEQRLYFAADGRLIRLLIGKKESKTVDENYSRLEKEVSHISRKLMDSYLD